MTQILILWLALALSIISCTSSQSSKTQGDHSIAKLDSPLPNSKGTHYYHSNKGGFYFVWPDSIDPYEWVDLSGETVRFKWFPDSVNTPLLSNMISISVNGNFAELDQPFKRYLYIKESLGYSIDSAYILNNYLGDTLYFIDCKMTYDNAYEPTKMFRLLMSDCSGCEVAATTNAEDRTVQADLRELAINVAYSVQFTPP